MRPLLLEELIGEYLDGELRVSGERVDVSPMAVPLMGTDCVNSNRALSVFIVHKGGKSPQACLLYWDGHLVDFPLICSNNDDDDDEDIIEPPAP